MSSRFSTCDYFLHLCLGWHVSALDALGHSGGTLVAWNPLLADLKAFNTFAGILLFGKLKGLEQTIHLLNVYGPYDNRKVFWDTVKANGLLSLPHLIIVGDLNFTWSSDEVWEAGRSSDPLDKYFISPDRKSVV